LSTYLPARRAGLALRRALCDAVAMHALLAGAWARRARAQLRLGPGCARGAHVGIVERGGALGGLLGIAARAGALAALRGHRLHQPRRRRLRARADSALSRPSWRAAPPKPARARRARQRAAPGRQHSLGAPVRRPDPRVGGQPNPEPIP